MARAVDVTVFSRLVLVWLERILDHTPKKPTALLAQVDASTFFVNKNQQLH